MVTIWLGSTFLASPKIFIADNIQSGLSIIKYRTFSVANYFKFKLQAIAANLGKHCYNLYSYRWLAASVPLGVPTSVHARRPMGDAPCTVCAKGTVQSLLRKRRKRKKRRAASARESATANNAAAGNETSHAISFVPNAFQTENSVQIK